MPGSVVPGGGATSSLRLGGMRPAVRGLVCRALRGTLSSGLRGIGSPVRGQMSRRSGMSLSRGSSCAGGRGRLRVEGSARRGELGGSWARPRSGLSAEEGDYELRAPRDSSAAEGTSRWHGRWRRLRCRRRPLRRTLPSTTAPPSRSTPSARPLPSPPRTAPSLRTSPTPRAPRRTAYRAPGPPPRRSSTRRPHPHPHPAQRYPHRLRPPMARLRPGARSLPPKTAPLTCPAPPPPPAHGSPVTRGMVTSGPPEDDGRTCPCRTAHPRPHRRKHPERLPTTHRCPRRPRRPMTPPGPALRLPASPNPTPPPHPLAELRPLGSRPRPPPAERRRRGHRGPAARAGPASAPRRCSPARARRRRRRRGRRGVSRAQRCGMGTSWSCRRPRRSPGGRAPDSVAGIAARALPSVVTLHVSGSRGVGHRHRLRARRPGPHPDQQPRRGARRRRRRDIRDLSQRGHRQGHRRRHGTAATTSPSSR